MCDLVHTTELCSVVVNPTLKWVFGLYQNKSTARYFVVEKRDRNTIIPLIKADVEAG